MSVMVKARANVLKAMTPATREIAEEFAEKLSKLTTGIALTNHKIGMRVREAMAPENEGTFGTDALKQLAAYFSIPQGVSWLQRIALFAGRISEEVVKKHSVREMANGSYMSMQHWLAVSELKGPKEQGKMIERIIAEGLSGGDVELLVKTIEDGEDGKKARAPGAGRKPKAPSSAIVGLQQTFELSQRFTNWTATAEKHVFVRLDEISANDVNDKLIKKAETTLAAMIKAETDAGKMREHLEENLVRLRKIMKGKGSAKKNDDGAAEAPAKKKKKKKRVPVSVD